MTVQEAIEILEPYKSCAFGSASHGGTVTGAEIIEILKKQVPQKVVMELDKWATGYDLYCPRCKKYFGIKGNRVFLGDKHAYCDCGQALDWSEVNMG